MTSKIQATRLENLFTTVGAKVEGDTWQGIEGVTDEGADLVDERHSRNSCRQVPFWGRIYGFRNKTRSLKETL